MERLLDNHIVPLSFQAILKNVLWLYGAIRLEVYFLILNILFFRIQLPLQSTKK